MSKAKEFIKERTHYCSNKMIASSHEYHEWLTPEQALKAVEIEREELIDKVCEWLNSHILDYTIYEPYLGGVVVNNDLFSDLKKQ